MTVHPIPVDHNDPTHVCTCMSDRGINVQLHEGQTIRVTLSRDLVTWADKTRTVTPAGTVYEGVAKNITDDGFFDVMTTDGSIVGFYAHDSTFTVEVL
ncbi:MAG: hypothetical protein HC837_06770 [Chloroflexaceae bacterium]|nr:hypothetical protein [Chloroflexaceae bacterium]